MVGDWIATAKRICATLLLFFSFFLSFFLPVCFSPPPTHSFPPHLPCHCTLILSSAPFIQMSALVFRDGHGLEQEDLLLLDDPGGDDDDWQDDIDPPPSLVSGNVPPPPP